MFQESLVESTPLLRSRNRIPLFTSIAVQASIAATLITIPLLHPELLPLRTPALTLIAPPLPAPRPPTPPPQPVHMEASAASSAPSAPAPPRIDRTLFQSLNSNSSDTPILSSMNLSPASGNSPATWGSAPTGPHVSVAGPAASPSHTLLTISRGVSNGLLLDPIEPVYPQIAKITRTEGTVVVQAIISTTGHIENAQVLSGPPMLQASALDAVRHAHYRPYLLNDQPTPVETTITITFHLGS